MMKVFLLSLAMLAASAASSAAVTHDAESRQLSEASPSRQLSENATISADRITEIVGWFALIEVLNSFWNSLEFLQKLLLVGVAHFIYAQPPPSPSPPAAPPSSPSPSAPPSQPPLSPSPSPSAPPSPPSIPFDIDTVTQDMKFAAYYTEPVGASVKIVVNEIGGGELGVAVYPVLSQYQASTLKELMYQGTTESVFTGSKDSSLSSGDMRSMMFKTGSGGGAGGDHDFGDLFIDYDEPLVANAQSGFNSQITQIRLTSNARVVSNANGHWFGGLGGKHVHGTSWNNLYESAPMYPYCPGHNLYGSRTTDTTDTTKNNAGSASAQSNCYNGNLQIFEVVITVWTADSTMPALVLYSMDNTGRFYTDTDFWGEEEEVGV